MKNKHFKNISNYYSVVDDLGRALGYIMDSSSEAVFGIEAQLANGVMSVTLVTPPYIRLGVEVPDTSILDDWDGLACYEGDLVEPHFLPLYGALNGVLLDELETMILADNEILEMQWLFKKRNEDWKDVAVDMYSSFLMGNDFPLPSKLVRKLQDKTLGILNKVGSFDTSRDYIEEVESKIMSDGYQFQLRVLIQSENPDLVKIRLEDVFKKYDSYNALRLYRQRPKRFKEIYRDRVLTSDIHTQILSRQEVVSLFGGEAPVIEVPEVVEVETVEEVQVEVVEQPKKRVSTNDMVNILPFYPREEVYADPNIVTNLAEAMKRVGLIRQARLFNEDVIAGVRLTIVQCDIPKGKTLTNIVNKATDIQAALGVQSLSVEQGDTPDTVKFAIPNEETSIVSLRELIELPAFRDYAKKNPLAFIVGVDEINNPVFLSLAKLVHLLVAGTTGSGKSVFVNALIVSLLAYNKPEMLRMYMIDPKQVEMQHYNGFPHVERVITDMDEAEETLSLLADEMDRRYTAFKDNGVKNILLYNQKVKEPMPYIVCVVDEYADLKDTNPEVEDYIVRLGQKARAAGIHMVLATQRPSANVVSGRIKANIQNAISFNLGNNTNYRTVFGQGIGSTTLLGRGDGIMRIEGYPKTFQRFQSSIISPDEAKEEEVFDNLRDYFKGYSVKPLFSDTVEEVIEEIEEEEEEPVIQDVADLLEKLKKTIATTEETKVEPLRRILGVKAQTMTDLMSQLVDEGWLYKHKSNVKGYEITASEEELEKYREKVKK
jgi:DNA segregation ATPase FtsK/SpoIIIE, S-DNA-T family